MQNTTLPPLAEWLQETEAERLGQLGLRGPKRRLRRSLYARISAIFGDVVALETSVPDVLPGDVISDLRHAVNVINTSGLNVLASGPRIYSNTEVREVQRWLHGLPGQVARALEKIDDPNLKQSLMIRVNSQRITAIEEALDLGGP